MGTLKEVSDSLLEKKKEIEGLELELQKKVQEYHEFCRQTFGIKPSKNGFTVVDLIFVKLWELK